MEYVGAAFRSCIPTIIVQEIGFADFKVGRINPGPCQSVYDPGPGIRVTRCSTNSISLPDELCDAVLGDEACGPGDKN